LTSVILASKGKALTILNKNFKKRKRPGVRTKRTLDMGLSNFDAVDADFWQSPGIGTPKNLKKLRKNTDTIVPKTHFSL